MMSASQSRATYRVLQNPYSAPDREYTADAMIVQDLGDGLCTLVVTPSRSDPFQVGPIVRADLRDPASDDFRVWEPADMISEGA